MRAHYEASGQEYLRLNHDAERRRMLTAEAFTMVGAVRRLDPRAISQVIIEALKISNTKDYFRTVIDQLEKGRRTGRALVRRAWGRPLTQEHREHREHREHGSRRGLACSRV